MIDKISSNHDEPWQLRFHLPHQHLGERQAWHDHLAVTGRVRPIRDLQGSILLGRMEELASLNGMVDIYAGWMLPADRLKPREPAVLTGMVAAPYWWLGVVVFAIGIVVELCGSLLVPVPERMEEVGTEKKQ